ncbi:MAG: helix-turn-helix transcriptional regulator [Clostridia bacterium]|nr:helix-turn-helix transcriptional regulator [Clostridia bacterium]
MKMMLAENIRTFRKERSLTQEQLAEALGVTAGAVYKWEAKLSITKRHAVRKHKEALAEFQKVLDLEETGE